MGGYPEQLFGKGIRQSNASVRCRISRHVAGMQRYSIPGQPLHVGHRRVVVEVGVVLAPLLQDREHTGGCLITGPTGTHRGPADAHALTEHIRLLLLQPDYDKDWSAWCPLAH